jgi:hypothetical protein
MKDCRSHFWLLYSQFVFSFRFGSRFLVPGFGFESGASRSEREPEHEPRREK